MSAAAAPARLKSVRKILDQETAWTREPAPENRAWNIPLPEQYTYASVSYMLTPLAYRILLRFGRIRYDKRGPCLLWAATKITDLAVELGNVKYTDGGRIVPSTEGIDKALLELEKKQLLEVKEIGKHRKFFRIREENFPNCDVPDATPSKSVASEESSEDDDGDTDAPTAAGEKFKCSLRVPIGGKKERTLDRHVNKIIVHGDGMVANGIFDLDLDEKGRLDIKVLQPRTGTTVVLEEYSRTRKNGHSPGIHKFLETATRCGVRGSDVQTEKALDLLSSYLIEDQIAAEAGIRERFEAGQYPRFAPAILKYVTERAWTDIVRAAKGPSPNGKGKVYETSAERRKRARQQERDALLTWAGEEDKRRGVL